MPEPHLEICKDCDNPMDNCRCEDWMAEDDARKPAASPVAGVSARIAEIRERLAKWEHDPRAAADWYDDMAYLLALIAAQPSAEGDGWIAVSERLPDEGEPVLVYSQYWSANPFVARLDKNRYWEGDAILSRPDSVTHWRPLPAPPVVKEGK